MLPYLYQIRIKRISYPYQGIEVSNTNIPLQLRILVQHSPYSNWVSLQLYPKKKKSTIYKKNTILVGLDVDSLSIGPVHSTPTTRNKK